VLAACPARIKPAIGLMMFTGLGPRDALTLPKGFYKAGEIATRRSKTSEPVFWECPAPLAAILAEAPTHDAITLCANSGGAGKVGPGLTLYGLRHTVAVILREIGMDERTIADALGQKTIEMARHYAKGADLKPKMRGVVKRFDEELAARKANKSVKPTE
jgi:integrase